jgi:hypothetical protein
VDARTPIDLDEVPNVEQYQFAARQFLEAPFLKILSIQEQRDNPSPGNSSIVISLFSK